MIIVNAPETLIDFKCYKCNAILKAHPMTNMNAPWITDCSRHKSYITPCEHESDAKVYFSNPVQYKCNKCGEFY